MKNDRAEAGRDADGSADSFPHGVVEGFYGPPWTDDQRLWMIRFTASLEMNSYIYAPKNDPFHRERWRDDYTDESKESIWKAAAACRDSGLLFRFALSPGLSITYSDSADRRRLLDKFLVFSDRGIDGFCLFLDDIPPRLAATRDRSAFAGLAAAQADLVNSTADGLRRRLGSMPPLFFCPTEYAWSTPSPYLETLGKELDPRIAQFWTGPRVVSPCITRDDAAAFFRVVGRKPLLWDNFPVNDFAPNRLFLSPLNGRESGLCDGLQGYFTNPMNQARASGVALRTVARFLHDPSAYDPQSAWVDALRETAPKGLEREFLLAALMFEPSPLDPDRTTSLSRAALKETDPPLSAAACLAREIEAAVGKLLRAADTSPLIEEISGWLRDTAARCRTVMGAAEAGAAIREGNRETAIEAARTTWPIRCRVGRSFTMASSEEIRKSEEVLLPLVREPGRLLFEGPVPFTESAPSCDPAGPAERTSMVVDAGISLQTSKLAASWGTPWQGEPPGDLPDVALSLDGKRFTPLRFERCGQLFSADTSTVPFRYVKITGRPDWHIYLVMENPIDSQQENAP